MPELILATERQFRKGQGIFVSQDEFPVETAPTEEAPLAQMVRARSCRAVILGIERYQKELYEALGASGGSEGAIMARFGVGHDGIDKALARRHNIVVTNTPGVLDASVAEHTIWLIGNLARKVPQQFRRTQDGNWQPETGIELSGKTLVVVGFGAIGRRVASIAHFGLGMKVLAVDVLSPRELAEAAGMTVQRMKATFGLNDCTTDLIGTLKDAHLVTLHIPASPDTANLFDARLLALMKRGALLVNTARGAVLDEDALYDALADGRLGGVPRPDS